MAYLLLYLMHCGAVISRYQGINFRNTAFIVNSMCTSDCMRLVKSAVVPMQGALEAGIFGRGSVVKGF
jgi:hypothetical protein